MTGDLRLLAALAGALIAAGVWALAAGLYGSIEPSRSLPQSWLPLANGCAA